MAVIILVFIYSAWYGAEMLIHGTAQRSAVDIFIAILISLSISGNIEKGVEASERNRKVAEQFAREFIEHVEKGKESKSGEDGSRVES